MQKDSFFILSAWNWMSPLWNCKPVNLWSSSARMKSSNWQSGSSPGPAAAPLELLHLLPACSDNSQCEAVKMPTPAARTEPQPDGPSPDPAPFHRHCFPNGLELLWDRPPRGSQRPQSSGVPLFVWHRPWGEIQRFNPNRKRFVS